MSNEALGPAQPQFVPGYTGYCPQYIFCIGDTYGSTTHKLLLDPNIAHAQRLVLSDSTRDSFEVQQAASSRIDMLRARERLIDTKFRHPITNGYEGHIPIMRNECGSTFAIGAKQALDKFSEMHMKRKLGYNQMIHRMLLQDGRLKPKGWQERKEALTLHSTPLQEMSTLFSRMKPTSVVDEPALEPETLSTDPYCMALKTRRKNPKTGYTGHIPYAYHEFGRPKAELLQKGLDNFSKVAYKRLTTEFVPVQWPEPDPVEIEDHNEIYLPHTGQLPAYSGHIPGFKFKFGETYGKSSFNAKQFLKGFPTP